MVTNVARSGRRAAGLCVLAGLGFAGAAHAANWTVIPQAAVQEVYTDNVTLTADDEEDDFVTEISPGVTITGQARRYQVQAFYRAQNLIYANDSERNDTFHLLSGTATGEFWEDRLFLDLSSDISQQNISNTGSVAIDDISVTDNRRQVINYSVSPYWQQRIGGYATSEVRFAFGKLDIEGEDLGSAETSESERVQVTIESGHKFTRLLWNFEYRREDVTFELGDDTLFEIAKPEVRYRLNRAWALLVNGGYENNEFESATGDTSGGFYAVGFTWTPNRRTTVDATVGDRFFGSTFFLNASHRTRRTELVAEYSEEPFLSRGALAEQAAFVTEDPFGNVIAAPTVGASDQLSVTIPRQSTEVQIQKRFSTSFRYSVRRNDFEVRYVTADREFQISGDEESSEEIRGLWSHRLSRSTTSTVRIDRIMNEFQGGDEDRFLIFGIDIARDLGKRLTATVGYRYADRESNVPTREYTENRVYLRIATQFDI